MQFAQFMASPLGRGARVVAGVVLIGLGLFAVSGLAAVALVAIGAVAFLAGALNFCLISPLLHVPFGGRHIRGHV